jgi:hypothetical protein
VEAEPLAGEAHVLAREPRGQDHPGPVGADEVTELGVLADERVPVNRGDVAEVGHRRPVMREHLRRCRLPLDMRDDLAADDGLHALVKTADAREG